MSSREDRFKKRSRDILDLTGDIEITDDEVESDFNDFEDFDDTDTYSAGEIIATGGLKTVWKVRDRRTSRYVAMAQLKAEFNSRFHDDRFLREAKILASLEHANIVPIHEINYDKDDRLFFTMKLLSGESLASVLKKIRNGDELYIKDYPLRKLLEIFISVCDAIMYAHNMDIVHLDLKPENIQITEYGEVYVLDWGMAKHTTDMTSNLYEENDATSFIPLSEHQTQAGSISGTPGFMSPEQTARDSGNPQIPSDIYSLGATLYNILYKEAPYHGLSINEIIEQTNNGDSPTPTVDPIGKSIPSAIQAIIEKSMSIKPNERYESVKELQRDIHLYLNDFATQAEDISVFKFGQLFLKRHYKSIAILHAVFLVIGFTLFYSYTEIKKQEKIATAESEKIKATTKEIVAGTIENDKRLRASFQFNEILMNYQKLRHQGFNISSFWYHEGKLHAGEFDFKKAIWCFKNAASLNKELPKNELYLKVMNHLEIAREISSKRTLSFRETLRYAINMHGEIQQHIFWNFYKNSALSKEDKILKFKEAIIYYNNLDPDTLNFKYEINDGYVKLDISNNKNLLQLVPIIGLPVDELNISNIDANIGNSINYLKNRLTVLDVSNSITNLSSGDISGTLEKIISKNNLFHGLEWAKATKLKYLDLEGTSIHKSAIPTPSKSLEYLNIAYSNFKYFDILPDCHNLKTVIADESLAIPQRIQDALKKRGVEIVMMVKSDDL